MEKWIKKEKTNRLESVRKNTLKLALSASLMLTPIIASPYTSDYLILPGKLKIEEKIDQKFEVGIGGYIKRAWNTNEGDVANKGLENLMEFEKYRDELNLMLEKPKDKEEFYIVANTLMKSSEYLILIQSAEESEELLYKVRKRIKEELEKDPYNIDLIELLFINDKIVSDLYREILRGMGGKYDDIRLLAIQSLKDSEEKLKKIENEMIENYKKFKKIKRGKFTTIFDYRVFIGTDYAFDKKRREIKSGYENAIGFRNLDKE